MLICSLLLLACSDEKQSNSHEAIKIDPNLPSAIHDTCQLYLNSKNYGDDNFGKAEIILNGYLKKNPNDAIGHYLRAFGYALTDPGTALEDLETALRIGLSEPQRVLAESLRNAFYEVIEKKGKDNSVKAVLESIDGIQKDITNVCSSLPPTISMQNNTPNDVGFRELLYLINENGYNYSIVNALLHVRLFQSSELLECSKVLYVKMEDTNKRHDVMQALEYMKLAVRLIVNFIKERQQSDNLIEVLNAIQILNTWIKNDLPPVPMSLRLRNRLIELLGEDEGQRSFIDVGSAIVKYEGHSDLAKQAWNELTPEEQSMLVPELLNNSKTSLTKQINQQPSQRNESLVLPKKLHSVINKYLLVSDNGDPNEPGLAREDQRRKTLGEGYKLVLEYLRDNQDDPWGIYLETYGQLRLFSDIPQKLSIVLEKLPPKQNEIANRLVHAHILHDYELLSRTRGEMWVDFQEIIKLHSD